MSLKRLFLKFLFVFYLFSGESECYTFDEELLVGQLPNSFLEFQFRFSSKWNRNLNDKVENYNLFPKRIADIVSKFKIKELHLTLSQGVWRQYQWGSPSLSAPTGAELLIVFEDDLTEETVDEYWIQSSRTISGLFGLSINLIDNPNTVRPSFLFNSSSSTNANVRYASIPNEFLCTENLTPWMKLLPCSNKGIAQLLKNPPRLFESNYFLLGLHFRQSCQDEMKCRERQLELSQTLSVVYDTTLFRNRNEEETVWSLSSVFTQKIKSFCPVSSLSNVYMDLNTNGISNTKPTSTIDLNNKQVYLYDLKDILLKSDEFNPMVVFKASKTAPETNEIVSIHRYVTDPNEIDFGLKTMITNNKNYDVSLIYFDTIPWYFRLYFNSLRIECNGTQIEPDLISLTPGLDRKRPHHVELSFNLNANSVCSVYFRAEYAFLKFDEYPPDVNHGFHINPALISIKLPTTASVSTEYKPAYVFSTLFNILNTRISSIKDKLVNVYTETLLMNLPTPDFSMPYNVICLTCTAVAIGFGSIHNFTTRKFKFTESKSIKEKVIDTIRKLFKRSN